MNKYIKEHMSLDILDEEVDYFHKDLHNKNVSVGVIANRYTENSYVSFEAGIGTPYPVLGEVISERAPTQEILSYSIYDIDYNNLLREDKVKDIQNFKSKSIADDLRITVNISIAKRLFTNFIRKRQSVTLDVINPTSQAFSLFGKSMREIQPANFMGTTFKLTTKNLSMFDTIKLSREGVVVSYINGSLVAILDANKMPEDIDGFLKFDLHEYIDNSSLKLTTVKFNMGNKNDDNFVYEAINESVMVDEIISDPMQSNYLHIQEYTGTIPINIDDTILLNGTRTMLNKTSASMIVEYDDGKKEHIQPYGICIFSNVSKVTKLKDYTFFLGDNDVKSSGDSLFRVSKRSFENRAFISASNISVRYSIKGNEAILDNYSLGHLYSVFNYFVLSGNIGREKPTCVATGILDSHGTEINALRFELNKNGNAIHLYEEEEYLYAKMESEASFTRIELSFQEYEEGEGIYPTKIGFFGSFAFTQQNDSMYGQVFRNKRFIYDVDYDIKDGRLDQDPAYGFAYPVDFFAVKRLLKACYLSNDFPLAGYDKVNKSKNSYNVGQISRVINDEDGQISIINSESPLDDIIDTRYKVAFSMALDSPAEILDFGMLTNISEGISPEENWMSKLMRDSDYESSAMSYCGTNTQENPEYGMFWIVFRDTNTKKEILVAEREYDINGRNSTTISPWQKQKRDCLVPVDNVFRKTGSNYCPNKYPKRIFHLDNHLVTGSGTLFEFVNTGNSYYAYSPGDGVLASLLPSNNSVEFGNNKLSMYFTNNQTVSSFTDTVYFEGGPVKYAPRHKEGDIIFYAIPEIGLVHVTNKDSSWLSSDYSTEEIKDINKRGVRYFDLDISISAYLEFDAINLELYAHYVLESDIETDVSFHKIIEMPEWYKNEVYESDKDSLFPRRYGVEFYYQDPDKAEKIEELKSIPMILSNRINSEYNHTQCVIACWDESVNNILLNEDIDIHEEESEIGSKLCVNKNGIEPNYIYDIVPIVNVMNKHKPYLISDCIIVKVRDTAIISNTDMFYEDDSPIAEAILNGDEDLADFLVMEMLGKNFYKDSPEITIAPVHYTQQDPWKNMVDYTTSLDKMFLDDKVKFTINSGYRLITDVKLGMRNLVNFSHEFKLFDENYIKVDGVVSRECLSDGSESEFIDSEDTYVLSYRNFYSGLFFMNRKIVADMNRYPNRRAYNNNNLLRELASPIREDAHRKKMDGRSVVAEWDIRYITNSLHTYKEIFYELPTAFTCDSLPEEAILSRDHENYQGFYKTAFLSFDGKNLFHNKGTLKGSFSNTTDDDIVVTMSFLNKNYTNNDVSYFADKPYFMFSKDKVWPSRSYNGKRNRVKTGIKLVGTVANGG